MITGKQISSARKSQGLTQAKLADVLGVSTEAVSKWEKDAYAPSAENEEKIYSFHTLFFSSIFISQFVLIFLLRVIEGFTHCFQGKRVVISMGPR